MTAPGGFWRRYAAWSLDAALVALVASPLLLPRFFADARALDVRFAELFTAFYGALGGDALDPARVLDHPSLVSGVAAVEAALTRMAVPVAVALVMGSLILHVAGECSRWQGSPGKRAMGLRVVDRHGAAIGAAHALARQLAGGLSWLTLNLGHAMAALPPDHLALHDRVSGTRVVRSASSAWPAWARAWLAVQAFTAVAATVALTGHLMQLAQAAAERAFGG
ncbi:RDD family protein [Lysobacter sp. LF1]|uniref:RDD family protein n=1 Tax=Lysobacter stagni TaxID=3045172 RepID=A0ABT6XDF8_9GAMM|nr:RDD family protein [Lysobacter sp. LF1]MDI9238181.1 RDD family protein [Lysobacter sp. LF1]